MLSVAIKYTPAPAYREHGLPIKWDAWGDREFVHVRARLISGKHYWSMVQTVKRGCSRLHLERLIIDMADDMVTAVMEQRR